MVKRPRKKDAFAAVSLKPALPETSLLLHELRSTWRSWLPQSLLIIAAGLWIFSPAFTGGWIWDDDRYIAQNHIVQSPEGFWKVWVNVDGQGNYYPLTSFAQWVQWQYWGNDTLGYHLTNVALHLLSAFLIWRLFSRIGLPLAWFGAVLFTVHPIMIESVAWISELKNTLSLPPLLLAMLYWLAWEERGERRSYWWSLGLFVMAMLAKTSGMMLPVIFLGHAWWKRGKISGSDLKAAAPFFVIALMAGLVTLGSPHLGGVSEEAQPMPWKLSSGLASVGWSILCLLGKSLFPVGLLPDYPGFATIAPTVVDVLPWLALGGFVWLLWRARARWSRHLLFGFGFFLVNLVPVLGFIFMKYPTMVWSMDHLLYLPVIGLIGLVVAGLGHLRGRLSVAWLAGERIFVAVLVILMAWEGHTYAGWYATPDIFWNNLLRREPGSWMAPLNLGTIALQRENYPEAIDYFQQVVRLRPDLDDGPYNIGLAFEKLGRTAEAQEKYRQTLAMNPKYKNAYLNLGEIEKRQGNLTEAESFFRQGLKAVPDDAPLRVDLGGILLQTGRAPEAISTYEEAVKLDPDLAQLQYNLGTALQGTGNLAEAEQHLRAAVTLDPKIVQAHENLGVILAQSGRLPEAIEQFEAVVQLDPQAQAARSNLALGLAQTGHLQEAIDQYQQLLKINPNDATAKTNLGKLQEILLKSGSGKN